jgi:monoamine oxidase
MSANAQDSTTSDRFDYAVAGAGVSGLYAAWRLLTDAADRSQPPPSVVVFEGGERIGGRLLTWLPMGPQAALRAELGGMRFLDSQELLWNLLPQIGFSEQDIIPFPVTGPNLRQLLRGVSGPLAEHSTARYRVPEADRDQPPDKLVAAAMEAVLGTEANKTVIQQILGGKSPVTRQDWDAIKPCLTWRDQPLWNLGFWNLLSDVLMPEAFQYIFDAFGYYSLGSNWNAAEAMQFITLDFLSVTYHTLRQGYGAVPEALADRIAQAGGRIQLGTRVVEFETSGAGPSTVTVQGSGGSQRVLAQHLLLALPRRSLELLATTSSYDIPGDGELKRLIESVTPHPAFKLFLFYDHRWWEERCGIHVGRSVSDLPIRQTYYMPPDPRQDDIAASPFGLLMASYDDARTVDFWQGMVPPEDLREQGRRELREAMVQLAGLAKLAADAVVDPPPHLHKATDEMLRHAKRQLALLHEIDEAEIPDPVVGAFADWGADPFGGGWNFWKPNVNVKDVMTQIKTPLGADRRVFIVGDGYSGAAGWVEGALTATEVVLQDHLGLARPGWLPPNYYLGW